MNQFTDYEARRRIEKLEKKIEQYDKEFWGWLIMNGLVLVMFFLLARHIADSERHVQPEATSHTTGATTHEAQPERTDAW